MATVFFFISIKKLLQTLSIYGNIITVSYLILCFRRMILCLM